MAPDGHDHRVLHPLGLHQPEHLGAEVLAPVRPADAAARDPARAQVHALDARRVHEDLEHRPGQREVGDRARVELERDARRRVAGGVGILEPVRAQRREHEVQERAQDAVLVEGRRPRRARCGCRRRGARSGRRHRSPRSARVPRVEPGDEQLDEPARDLGVRGERVLDVRLAERRADLAEVAAVRAQQRDLAPRRARR